MSDEPLLIDVVTGAPAGSDAPVIVVEPLYAVPAVAAALDAGWGSVEIAGLDASTAPIPLVSFEVPPAPDQRGGRCRVRCADLPAAARRAAGSGAPVLLGAPVIGRPLASQLVARATGGRLVLQLVPAGEERLAQDAMWAAGMLIRILLEELEGRPSRLGEAAGIAVTLARGAEEPRAQLSSGARWRGHLERGGHPDDLRIASAIDTIGIVPRVMIEGDALVARPWSPA